MSKRKRIHAGIGDKLDLMVKKPSEEIVEETFKYQHRYKGKEKHEVPFYPELPFEYSISYKGETLEDFNEENYVFDIYAHPEKTFHYKVKEKKVLPVDRLWEVEAIFEADVQKNNLLYAIVFDAKYPGLRQNTLEWKLKLVGRFYNGDPLEYYYAVKWKGVVPIGGVSSAKAMFRQGAPGSHLIGCVNQGGSNKNWDFVNDTIVDKTNTPFVSAIYNSSQSQEKYYEATLTFKPVRAHGYNSARRRSGNGWVTEPGFDDDMIGILFKVKDRNNFYALMIEGTQRAYNQNASRPPDDLENYDINDDERVSVPGRGSGWPKFTARSLNEHAEGASVPSSSHEYENNRGWGKFHRRIYKCVNGKLKRVDMTGHGARQNGGTQKNPEVKDQYASGRGWDFNKNHKVRIVSSGRTVQIFMKWYDTPEYKKLYEFEVENSFAKGGIGLFNVSQAVQFSSIQWKKYKEISGRRPKLNEGHENTGYEYWVGEEKEGGGINRTKNLGKIRSWLHDSIVEEKEAAGVAGNGELEIISMKKDIRPGYESNGSLTIPSDDQGDLIVKCKKNSLNEPVSIEIAPDDEWWMTDNPDQVDYGDALSYLESLSEFKNFLNESGYDPDDFELDEIIPIIKDASKGNAWINEDDGHFYTMASQTEVWKVVSGRIPGEDDWFSWAGSGDYIHANVAKDFIIQYIKGETNYADSEESDDGDYNGTIQYDLDGLRFTTLKGEVDNPQFGEVIINSPTAPIIARNYNSFDAGEHLKQRFVKCGVAHITPDNNYDNCVTAFEDITELFKEEHDMFFERKDLENVRKVYNLVLPVQKPRIEPDADGVTSTEGGCFIEAPIDEDENVIQCYEDFFFDGMSLCMWSCEFPIVETEVEFFDKVHAYDGLMRFDPLSYFNPNDWTTYKLFLDETNINWDLDTIYWENLEPFEESHPGTKLMIKTKEYYIAKYPEGVTNKGIVTSDKQLYVKLPEYPNYFFDDEGKQMPGVYEKCDFLLDGFNNSPHVVMNWISDATTTNSVITVDENYPTLNGQFIRSKSTETIPATPFAAAGRQGIPIMKVSMGDNELSIRHFVEITCLKRPFATEWRSGKYVGKGVLNGRRPFLTGERGKNDITGVRTDVVKLPYNIIPETLKGPYIEVLDINQPKDSRVKYVYDKETNTISFSSEHMDKYVWYTDWFSEWIQSSGESKVLNNEEKQITTITSHFLGEDFDYDKETRTVTIEDIELVTNHPFVYIWKNNLTKEQLDAINNNQNMSIKIYAQVVSSMPLPWSPMIHNGYYYQDGVEHYLYANKIAQRATPNSQHDINLSKRPEQGSPIIVKDNQGKTFRKTTFYNEQTWEQTHRVIDEFNGTGKAKYYLKFDKALQTSLKVFLNNQQLSDTHYIFDESNGSIEFMYRIHKDDLIQLEYELAESYLLKMNTEDSSGAGAAINIQKNRNVNKTFNMSIEYEGATNTPYYRAEEVKLNPLLNNFHNGFLYIDNEEIQKPYFIELKTSHEYVERYQKDRIMLTTVVTDELRNPVPNEVVAFYCNGNIIGTKVTNSAGEAYITHVPPEDSDLVVEYKTVCGTLFQVCSVNQTRENEINRYFIEIEADSLIMKANSTKENKIKFSLRDMQWNKLKDGYAIDVILTDTHGVEHTVYLVTDENGDAEINLTAIGEVPGEIFIRAQYDMLFEDAISTKYIRIISE